MPKIRVLVVDDSVVVRKLISQILQKDSQIEVVGTASNGRIALQRIPQVNPDIVTLDMEMPELDGLATVQELRKDYPKLPVIMVSSFTEAGAVITLRALSCGATDYVTKPDGKDCGAAATRRFEEELIPKLKIHCRHLLPNGAVQGFATSQPQRAAKPGVGRIAPRKSSRFDIVCIGVSTGGPNALAEVFSALVQPVNVPIVLVQHMPPMFTQMLAERLNVLKCSVKFQEGEDGSALEAGCVYIAPGGKHMEVRREGTLVVIRLHEGPPENSCRPAVDVLFRSVVSVYGGAILGVILTGMGQDGLRGCELIAESGGRIFAQDERSSVVWGMPGFVAQAGLADEVLPLEEMGRRIMQVIVLNRYAANPTAPTVHPANPP